MKSFFAELVHTEEGVTCSDSGFMDLSTEEECAGAVNYAKSFNSKASFHYAATWSTLPKGCIIGYNGNILFNKHSTGGQSFTTHSVFGSICRKGNT